MAYVSASQWVAHTIRVRERTYEWLAAVLDAEIAARDVVLDEHSALLARYRQDVDQAEIKAQLVGRLTAESPSQADDVKLATAHAHTLVDQLNALLELKELGRRAEALALLAQGAEHPQIEAFRRDIDGILAPENRLLAERRAQAKLRAWLTAAGVLLLIVASSGLWRVAWRNEEEHRAHLTELASLARERLARLSQLATALAESRSRRQVADVVVEHGLQATGADILTLHLFDEQSGQLELAGQRGVAAEILERIRRIGAASTDPQIFDAWKAGAPIWAESDADYEELQPSLSSMGERRARAFWSLPLIAEERSIGLLGAGFREPRRFSADERAFVETLAKQCAQALLRAARTEGADEAREWLGTILRSIGDAVIATDAEGRIAFMNSVAESLTGWPQSEARGSPLQTVFAIFSEETRQPVESPVTKVLREGTVVGLANHTLLRSRRGLEIPIDDSGAPIRQEGRIRGVVLVFRDNTDEKRNRVRNEFLAKAGEALSSSLDYPSTLAAVARLAVPTIADWCAVDLVEPGNVRKQVAIAHVDPDKVAMARDLGERYRSPAEATTGAPQVIRSGQSELHREVPQELLERAAQDDEHLRMLRSLRIESGMVVALRAHGEIFGAITFVYADSGRRYDEGDLAFAEDFARRAAMAIVNARALKDTEEARQRERWLRGEAEAANRAKDEFLATVSHELRTPLNAILGWTVLLQAGIRPEKLQQGLTVIERNARAQARLVDDILDISRIITGKLALDLVRTNVGEVVNAAIQTVSPAASAKDIAIVTELDDETSTIVADPDRVQQIAWNLLSNAVKFTPRGGRVHVRVARAGSEVRLRVSDSGEGIEPSALPYVFDRFQQGDSSTTRRHAGLGLGLAIVKQLVLAHGGTVSAQSEGGGKGATFEVVLPDQAVLRAVTMPAAGSARSHDSEPPIGHGPRLDGLRVLVVDDQADARELVAEILRERGAEVDMAGSAGEAMTCFGAAKPDVVVSDIGMPGADGYELVRRIRALRSEQGGLTPAVALTAYARTDDRSKAIAAGYHAYLAKPIEPIKLVTTVVRLHRRVSGST